MFKNAHRNQTRRIYLTVDDLRIYSVWSDGPFIIVNGKKVKREQKSIKNKTIVSDEMSEKYVHK